MIRWLKTEIKVSYFSYSIIRVDLRFFWSSSIFTGFDGEKGFCEDLDPQPTQKTQRTLLQNGSYPISFSLFSCFICFFLIWDDVFQISELLVYFTTFEETPDVKLVILKVLFSILNWLGVIFVLLAYCASYWFGLNLKRFS